MKIVGFLFRLFLVVALVVWLADRPGEAHIVWRDYEIDMTAAVLVLLVLAFSYATVLLHRMWRFLWDGPRFWKYRREISKRKEGEAALAKGLALIAAGQGTEAGRFALKSRSLIGETPISQLIQAQAAQLSGDKESARKLFEAMTEKKETALLGYRGLITAALQKENYDEVARLAERIERDKLNVPWLHTIQYKMATRLENWGRAEKYLTLVRKQKALEPEKLQKNETALFLASSKEALTHGEPKKALAYAEKAYKADPNKIQAVLLLAETRIMTGHHRAAWRILEKAWKKDPHPQIIPLAIWSMKAQKPVDAYKAIKKMTSKAASNQVALMALAKGAIDAELWGEARRFLEKLVAEGQASKQVYKLYAKLERAELRDELMATKWIGKAIEASDDPTWICSSCGAVHDLWEANCSSCGAFDHLIWSLPGRAFGNVSYSQKSEMLEYLG